MSDKDEPAGPRPVGVAGAGLVHVLIDRLAAIYADGSYTDEATAARAQYFTQSGGILEEDGELFEQRLAAFLEWYLLERPLAAVGKPPVVHALEQTDPQRSETDAAALGWLAASHRSLFDITAVTGGKIDVSDLLGGGRFVVRERRSTIGFQAGDVVEARLVFSGEDLVFGKTFLFHPADARTEVLAAIEAARARSDSGDVIMFALARLHLRWHRQGHVQAARVYREALLR